MAINEKRGAHMLPLSNVSGPRVALLQRAECLHASSSNRRQDNP
ncbi:MAG: hypothetical protein ABIF82_01180 [Planctomycetota bacterium]